VRQVVGRLTVAVAAWERACSGHELDWGRMERKRKMGGSRKIWAGF
jgi:hypothetical protein